MVTVKYLKQPQLALQSSVLWNIASDWKLLCDDLIYCFGSMWIGTERQVTQSEWLDQSGLFLCGCVINDCDEFFGRCVLLKRPPQYKQRCHWLVLLESPRSLGPESPSQSVVKSQLFERMFCHVLSVNAAFGIILNFRRQHVLACHMC